MKLKVKEHPTEKISLSLLNKIWGQDSFCINYLLILTYLLMN